MACSREFTWRGQQWAKIYSEEDICLYVRST